MTRCFSYNEFDSLMKLSGFLFYLFEISNFVKLVFFRLEKKKFVLFPFKIPLRNNITHLDATLHFVYLRKK